LWDIRQPRSHHLVYSAQASPFLEEKNLEKSTSNFFLEISPNQQHILTGGVKSRGHIIDMKARANMSVKNEFDYEDDQFEVKAHTKLNVYNKNKYLIGSSFPKQLD